MDEAFARPSEAAGAIGVPLASDAAGALTAVLFSAIGAASTTPLILTILLGSFEFEEIVTFF